MTFQALFPHTKPVVAMLHLKSDSRLSMLDRAKKETDIFLENGVEAVMVENYFGSAGDCERVLRYLNDQRFPLVYGVNVLGDYAQAFSLAGAYNARLIQIDSVCGHLRPGADEAYALRLNALRAECPAVVLGGVRFKYQPILSGRTVEEDLRLGMERCGAIVVTGEGTGVPTPMGKAREFRQAVGDFPLIVGAGVTPDALEETFSVADGAIVGSWLKEGHRDFGDVNPDFVKEFMTRKRACCEQGGN